MARRQDAASMTSQVLHITSLKEFLQDFKRRLCHIPTPLSLPRPSPNPLGNRLDLSPATEIRILLDVVELAAGRYAAPDALINL